MTEKTKAIPTNDLGVLEKTVSVKLTEAELWQVINSLSQAPAEDDDDFISGSEKISDAWLKLWNRNLLTSERPL